MSLSQKLQEYRQSHKLSQEELANQLGVSRQSVSKWEQGLSFPETEKLITLSTMMGISIDSLLKDTPDEPVTPPPEDPTPEPEPDRPWLKWLGAGLIVLLAIVAIAVLYREPASPTPPAETTAPAETTQAPEPTISPETTLPAETEPVPMEPKLRTPDLPELQAWFFDFAREYRLDYMPHFTREDGAPTDDGEYLYWAFVINLDNWGDEKGTMRESYVRDTVYTHFRTTIRSQGNEGWTYDNISQVYTAIPGGIKEPDYYLLNSIEIRNGEFTIHATRYYSRYIYLSEEEVFQLRDSLFNGTNIDLLKRSDVTLTFTLDPGNHFEPIFYAHTESFVNELVS